MAGWHHWLHGHEFEWTGVGDGQGGLACCNTWDRKELDTTERLNWTGLYSPWNSPGQNAGMGSRSLLQGFLSTQGSNPGLPHCRRILYQMSHQESPRLLEWVAYPFSSRSSRPRNWTEVPCIANGFFTSWATRKQCRRCRFNPWSGNWGPICHGATKHTLRLLSSHTTTWESMHCNKRATWQN